MKEDLKAAVHKIDSNAPDKPIGFTHEVGVDDKMLGYTAATTKANKDTVHREEAPRIDPDDPKCYAKLLVTKDGGEERSKYFVKINFRGELFDPWGIFSEGREKRYLKHTGKDEWNFQTVGKNAFLFYLMFLKTRNRAYLTHAQREVRNA